MTPDRTPAVAWLTIYIYTYTVAIREIETTGFDPAKACFQTHIDEASTQPASFFQKRPVVSIKETHSAGFPHTQPAGLRIVPLSHFSRPIEQTEEERREEGREEGRDISPDFIFLVKK